VVKAPLQRGGALQLVGPTLFRRRVRWTRHARMIAFAIC
jgi:hypothetical protein